MSNNDEVLGFLVITAINGVNAESFTVAVLAATEDDEGWGTFRVRNENGEVYEIIERPVAE